MARTEFATPAISLSLGLVSKRCPGHTTAASARSASSRPLDTGNIPLNHQREWAMGRGLFALSLARLFSQTANSPNAKLPGKRRRNYGTDAARSEQAGQCSESSGWKERQIAHRRIEAGRQILAKGFALEIPTTSE